MKKVLLLGTFLTMFACSNNFNETLTALKQDSRGHDDKNPSLLESEEISFSLDLQSDSDSLKLIGSNPIFDYKLSISCIVYGSPWSKIVTRTQIEQKQVTIPKDGKDCFAFINELVVDVGNFITFVPTIPAATNGSTLFGGYQVNSNETYSPNSQISSGSASAIVTLTSRFAINGSQASVGYRFTALKTNQVVAAINLPSNQLQWRIPCGQNTPGVDSGNILVGGGAHQFEPIALQKEMDLKISGTLCPPQDRPRDLILIFDVSGSMDDTDPYQNSTLESATCGRYQAYLSVLDTLGSGSRLSIVTFSTSPVIWSDKFYSDRISLEKALLSQFPQNLKIQDILCTAFGETNYASAFDRAIILASNFRSTAQKEVYLLTDGAPNSGAEGFDKATTLKTTYNVRLGSVLLNRTDSASRARETLAQIVSSPELTVEASSAGALAGQFQSLTRNVIESASISLQSGNNTPVSQRIPITAGLGFLTSWAIPTATLTEYKIQIQVRDRISGPLPPLTGSVTIKPRPQ